LRRGGSADRGGLDDHGDDGWMQVGKHGKPASVSVSPLRIRSIMPDRMFRLHGGGDDDVLPKLCV
jgi:hypothetical protein